MGSEDCILKCKWKLISILCYAGESLSDSNESVFKLHYDGVSEWKSVEQVMQAKATPVPFKKRKHIELPLILLLQHLHATTEHEMPTQMNLRKRPATPSSVIEPTPKRKAHEEHLEGEKSASLSKCFQLTTM
jgi:hypothetical protein